MDDGLSSSPSSRDGDFVFDSYPQRVFIASVLCLVTVVGVIGNSQVILAVLLCRKLKSPTNWLVANLGMADFITCVFLPFNVVAMLSKDGWPVAEWICAMTGAVTLTCLGASMINLALIAHNRWMILTRARYTYYSIYSKRNIIIMVMLSWIYPFLLVIVPPIAGLGKLGYSENYKTCQQDTTLPNSDYYSLMAAVGVIVPVFVIIVIIYVLIYRFVSRHNDDMKRKFAKSRQIETSSCDRSSIDMSWTDYQDRQKSANTDGSTVSSLYFRDGVGMRPTFQESFTPENASNLTGIVNLEATASAKGEVDEIRRNISHIPETATEICESGDCAVGKIEFSRVQSETEKRVSIAESRLSQENLELNSISPTSRRVVHASTAVAEVSKSHHINVTKRLSLVVLSFFICFLPFGICVMVPPSDPAVPWANLLVMVNSCINPIIYAGTMPVFREVMGCIARCKFQNIPEPVEFVRSCRGSV